MTKISLFCSADVCCLVAAQKISLFCTADVCCVVRAHVLLLYEGSHPGGVLLQAHLGDDVDVQLHEGTRVTGYAPNSEDVIGKEKRQEKSTLSCTRLRRCHW